MVCILNYQDSRGLNFKFRDDPAVFVIVNDTERLSQPEAVQMMWRASRSGGIPDCTFFEIDEVHINRPLYDRLKESLVKVNISYIF